MAYNGYEVYSGRKDIATAAVDVAKDTASSAAGLYVAGEVFGVCMEGGIFGGPYGALACGAISITAGILTDMGVRSGLEFAEYYTPPSIADTKCFMEMNQKRTVSIDCDGNMLFPDLYSLSNDKTEISQIDVMMKRNQKKTISPDIETKESKYDGGFR